MTDRPVALAPARTAAPAGANNDTLVGVAAALRILNYLLEHERATVRAIAKQLDLGRSQVHRMLQTLHNHGYAFPAESGQGFTVGIRVLDMADPTSNTLPDLLHHHAILTRIQRIAGETAHITRLLGRHAFVIDGRRVASATEINLRVGMLAPAHTMAAGKLLLSALDPNQVLALYPDEEFTPAGPRSVTTRAQLLAELTAARHDGYALATQESEYGFHSIAIPLWATPPPSHTDGNWRDRLAVVLTVPSTRGGEKRLRQLAEVARVTLRDADYG